MRFLSPRGEGVWVAVVLGLALAKGCFNLLHQPWSLYDEPGHLEYALFVTEHGRLPDRASIDIQLRQRLSAAFAGTDCRADRPGVIQGCLGHHQLDEPPGYYVLAALVQAPIGGDSVRAHLRAARLVSLLLFALGVLAAYVACRTAFPERRLLATAVPVVMAVLPGYASFMTVVNNDALASCGGSALLLSVTALLRYGPSARWFLALALTALICVLAKPTAAALLPAVLLGLWMLLSIRRWGWHVAAAAVSLAGMLVLFDWQGSAHWRKTSFDHHDRTRMRAPLGSYAFDLKSGWSVSQWLPLESSRRLHERVVTLGAWMRAPDGILRAEPPFLDDGSARQLPAAVVIGEQWRFVAWAARIRGGRGYVRVVLKPPAGRVQYDGVVLAEGDHSRAGPPHWLSEDASTGLWSGRPVSNLIRNGSAEAGWPLMRDSVNRLLPLGGGINRSILGWLDWRTDPGHFGKRLTHLLMTFWRTSAWANPRLRGPDVAVALALTVVAALGMLASIVQWMSGRNSVQPAEAKVVAVYVVAAASGLFFALLRVEQPSLRGPGFLSGIRYAYPAIVPMVTLLVLGLGRWIPVRLRSYALAIFVGALYLEQFYGR